MKTVSTATLASSRFIYRIKVFVFHTTLFDHFSVKFLFNDPTRLLSDSPIEGFMLLLKKQDGHFKDNSINCHSKQDLY